jgi:hypothetical protein
MRYGSDAGWTGGQTRDQFLTVLEQDRRAIEFRVELRRADRARRARARRQVSRTLVGFVRGALAPPAGGLDRANGPRERVVAMLIDVALAAARAAVFCAEEALR